MCFEYFFNLSGVEARREDEFVREGINKERGIKQEFMARVCLSSIEQ